MSIVLSKSKEKDENITYVTSYKELNLDKNELKEMREGMLLKNQATTIEKEFQCGTTPVSAVGILKTNSYYKLDKPCQDSILIS